MDKVQGRRDADARRFLIDAYASPAEWRATVSGGGRGRAHSVAGVSLRPVLFRELGEFLVGERQLDALEPVAVAAGNPPLFVDAGISVELVVVRNRFDLAPAEKDLHG